MVSFVQYLIALPLRIIFSLLFQIRVFGEKNVLLLHDGPIIIVSNHGSRIDPFLIGALNYRSIIKLIPVHFLTAEKYYNKIWIRPFIQLLGAYSQPIKAWTYEDYLEGSLKKLRAGKNIMMFPEGRMTFNRIEGKPGISYLIRKTASEVLPVHLIGLETMTLGNILLRRCKIELHVGKPFFVTKTFETKEDYRNISNEILDTIYSL